MMYFHFWMNYPFKESNNSRRICCVTAGLVAACEIDHKGVSVHWTNICSDFHCKYLLCLFSIVFISSLSLSCGERPCLSHFSIIGADWEFHFFAKEDAFIIHEQSIQDFYFYGTFSPTLQNINTCTQDECVSWIFIGLKKCKKLGVPGTEDGKNEGNCL